MIGLREPNVPRELRRERAARSGGLEVEDF
jgi:hypothetical protein